VRAVEYLGKFNGVVGNFNAQTAAYPDVPWEEIARGFVEHLGLAYNPVTTQIESHDYMAECFHAVIRFNNILLDFARDMWSYISMDYFGQRVVGEEVGSSTMPHKVNPIKFETCEANVGLSNAILGHLANKLAVSRLQRDLSDTSAQRNIGVGIAHSCVAMQHARLGFERLSVNHQVLEKELAGSWEVLAEAVQTVMRKCGYDKPYERLKALTRGTDISREELQQFISDLELPEEDKKRLLALTPRAYVGLAPDLVRHVRQ
jgi:adenylosuccinate lyase